MFATNKFLFFYEVIANWILSLIHSINTNNKIHNFFFIMSLNYTFASIFLANKICAKEQIQAKIDFNKNGTEFRTKRKRKLFHFWFLFEICRKSIWKQQFRTDRLLLNTFKAMCDQLHAVSVRVHTIYKHSDSVPLSSYATSLSNENKHCVRVVCTHTHMHAFARIQLQRNVQRFRRRLLRHTQKIVKKS